MQISATGILNNYPSVSRSTQYSPSRHHGFTLIELAIVLLIIGIITSFASLSVRPMQQKPVKQEAEKLRLLIESASQQAILTATPIRITLNTPNLAFDTLSDKGWKPIKERPFESVQLSKQIHIETETTENNIQDKQQDKNKDEGKNLPRLFFLPTGETSPFKWILTDEDTPLSYQLEGDGVGHLFLKPLNHG